MKTIAIPVFIIVAILTAIAGFGYVGGKKNVDLAVPEAAVDDVVDLSNRGLTAIPTEFFKRRSITILDLSDNKLTGVPAEVGQLSDLRILDISNNPITGLPYEIGNLRKLQILDLRGTSYSKADLEVIMRSLPTTTTIMR